MLKYLIQEIKYETNISTVKHKEETQDWFQSKNGDKIWQTDFEQET